MKRWVRSIMLLAVLALSPFGAAANEKTPLVLGVFPYVSPGQLAAFHTPLKEHLAKSLQRPITLVTAPDFQTFIERTRTGQYDIIITAPHLGRLAETRDGYQRLAQTGHVVQGIFLVRKESDIHRIEDLKGRTVMIAQQVSLFYQMAEQLLRQKGLVPGESVTIIETRTHNNAMHAPVRGEADASVTGTLLWRVLEDEQKNRLRVIGTTEELPGFLLMANKRLSAPDVARIKGLLLDFHQVPGSESYFATTGYERFKHIDDRVMRRMDRFTRILTTPARP